VTGEARGCRWFEIDLNMIIYYSNLRMEFVGIGIGIGVGVGGAVFTAALIIVDG
jgi:hypothetical protein